MTINGKIINDIEPTATFKGICDGPKQLLEFIISNILFEYEPGDSVLLKDTIPTGPEKSKLWVKTSWPYGIGMLIDGEYQMDYGMSGYPVNIPFLHPEITLLKEGLQRISDSTLETYGISPTNSDATNRMYWYMFTPPSLI